MIRGREDRNQITLGGILVSLRERLMQHTIDGEAPKHACSSPVAHHPSAKLGKVLISELQLPEFHRQP